MPMLDAFYERKNQVVESLTALTDVALSVGAISLAERVRSDVVDKLERDRFHLVVVGEFNHGKTTFVNALLGRQVLPVGVTPTTAVIHHIVYGDEPSAKLVKQNGEEQSIPFDDVRSFATGGSRSAEDAVSYLEVAYPAELLRERIVLVDTPGVNDLSLTRAEITYGYIPRADAVLFLLDAGQPMKESERQFLENQLIGKSRDKIVFVVAKSDIWSSDEKKEALEYVKSRLGALVKDPPVFAVSAQASLGERADSGIEELVGHLTRFLAEERGRILLSNALGEGIAAASVLGRGIEARKRASSMSIEQLEKRIRLLERDLEGHSDTIEKRRLLIREEAGSIKAWARRDLDRFCDDVVRQLPAVLDRANASDLKQHLGPFLEHSFKQWAEAETREIASALEQLAEKMVALVKDDAHDVGKRVSSAMGAELHTPKIEVDRFAYDVGIFAVLSLGMGVLFANALLGGLLIVAAPALALWNRDRTEAETKKRALELAPVVLRETAGKVAPKIDEMVEDFASRLDEWVVTTGQELHKEIIEVLQHVREERVRGERDQEGEIVRCAEEAERLVGATTRLEALRAEIVGGNG